MWLVRRLYRRPSNNVEDYRQAIKKYGTRGTQVRSAEGSAIGRTPEAAADARALARSGVARAARMRTTIKI